jgi:hypothetical protein
MGVEERLLLEVRQLRKYKRLLIKSKSRPKGMVAPNETRPRMLRRRWSFLAAFFIVVRTLPEILSFCTHYRKTGCVPAKVCLLEISHHPTVDIGRTL